VTFCAGEWREGGLELFYAGAGAGGGRPISYYLRRCCLPTGTP
jgi:hypothetical protein